MEEFAEFVDGFCHLLLLLLNFVESRLERKQRRGRMIGVATVLRLGGASAGADCRRNRRSCGRNGRRNEGGCRRNDRNGRGNGGNRRGDCEIQRRRRFEEEDLLTVPLLHAPREP